MDFSKFIVKPKIHNTQIRSSKTHNSTFKKSIFDNEKLFSTQKSISLLQPNTPVNCLDQYFERFLGIEAKIKKEGTYFFENEKKNRDFESYKKLRNS